MIVNMLNGDVTPSWELKDDIVKMIEKIDFVYFLRHLYPNSWPYLLFIFSSQYT